LESGARGGFLLRPWSAPLSLAREAEAFVRFKAAFKGFLLFPFAQLFYHALGFVKFLDVAVPLFRKILGLLLPLLPMAVGELLRGPEEVIESNKI
jgi:hypothetical protein